MGGSGTADRWVATEPEAWIQGAIARLFGDRWEAKPLGVPADVMDAWRLGNLQAPAIDLESESLIELEFPIDQWGTPQEGYVCVRRVSRGMPQEVVTCTTRGQAVSVACRLAMDLDVSSVRVREQKGEGVLAGGQIDSIVALEELTPAVCRTGPSWESAATRAYLQGGLQD